MLEGSAERPGALPVQALDHGTGYLPAAAVLRALTEQSYEGGSRFVRLALARTALWLTDGADGRGDEAGMAAGDVANDSYDGPEPWLPETDRALGRLRYALSPVSFEGGPADWNRPPVPWGTDAARWY